MSKCKRFVKFRFAFKARMHAGIKNVARGNAKPVKLNTSGANEQL